MVKPRLWTSGEIADELGISRRAIARYAKDGLLVPTLITPGGQYRWNLDDVRRQLAELRQSRQHDDDGE